MDTEKRIKKLEERQKFNEKAFSGIGEVFEALVEVSDSQIKLNNFVVKLLPYVLRTTVRVFIFLLIIIFRKEIITLLVWIGQFVLKLSENWQIGLFVVISNIITGFLLLRYGKKLSSKKSKNTN